MAAEVAQAFAQAQLAARRVEVAEKGVRSALNSADKNLVGLGQTKSAGNQFILVIRPQEVVASVQALAQAYADYYGAVADYDRAQFRLYRALGQPAQAMACPPPNAPGPEPARPLPDLTTGTREAPRPRRPIAVFAVPVPAEEEPAGKLQ